MQCGKALLAILCLLSTTNTLICEDQDLREQRQSCEQDCQVKHANDPTKLHECTAQCSGQNEEESLTKQTNADDIRDPVLKGTGTN